MLRCDFYQWFESEYKACGERLAHLNLVLGVDWNSTVGAFYLSLSDADLPAYDIAVCRRTGEQVNLSRTSLGPLADLGKSWMIEDNESEASARLVCESEGVSLLLSKRFSREVCVVKTHSYNSLICVPLQ